MANVGSAYIAIIPQMKGIKSSIGKELQGAGAEGKVSFSKAFKGAGADLGKSLGGEFSKAFAGQRLDTSNMTAYRNVVRALEGDVEKAAAAQAAAAGKTQVAEQKLQAVRTQSVAAAQKVKLAEARLAQAVEKHGKDSIQAQQAQIRLTQAIAAQESVDGKVTSATQALTAAREKQKNATDSLTKAQDALKTAQESAASGVDGLVQGAGGKLDRLKELASGVGEKLKNGLSTAFNVMKENAIAAIGAVVAAGKGLYEVGAVFDNVSDTIRVGTGASGASLKGMEKIAREIGKTVPTSFESAGAAVADWNTRMGLTGASLQKVASQSETLKSLGLEANIRQLSAAFNVWGKTVGSDVSEAMDTLFRVSQATGMGINELASSVQQNAPALQELGFSFENSAAMVGVLDKAGLESQKILTAMSKSLVTLAKDGEQPREAFKRVTSEIQGFIDKGNDAAAIDLAGKVFGARAATQMIGALKNSKLSFDDMASAAGLTGDTIIGVGQATADFAEKWAMFKSKVLDALSPLGSAVFDSLGSVIDKVSSGFDKLTSGGLAPLGPMLGGAVFSIGGLAGLLGPLASQIPVVGGAFAGLTGPIGLAVGAFVGMLTQSKPLQDALIRLAQSFMPLLEVVGQVAARLLAALGPVLGALGDALAPLVETLTSIVTTLTGLLTPIIEALIPLLETILGAISPLIKALTPLITAIISIIQTALSPLIGFLQAILVPVIENLASFISTALNAIMSVVTPVIAAISAYVSMLAALLRGDFSTAWQEMKNVIANVWEALKNLVKGATSIVKAYIQMAWSNVQQITSNMWGGIESAISRTWENIKTGVLTAANTVKTIVSEAWGAISGAVSNGVSNVVNLTGSLPGKLVAALGNLGSLLVNSGRALIEGFKNGIMSAFNTVKNTVANGLTAIRRLFPFSPAKEGPFSGKGWVLYSGLSLSKAFAQGIENNTSLAEKSALALVERTRNAIQTPNAYTTAGKTGKTLNNTGNTGGGRLGGVTIIQNIATATTPAASKLASDAAAAARIWGAIA